ncbi:DMT family transporter [Roseibium sp.]|uniref:DMT family transporter n=1 Tax=Roseibium sp. TaxID=1936156 RepID=UPI003A98726C
MATHTPSSTFPVLAAVLMVLAGASFAAVNVALQTATMKLGMPSSSVVFWQYGAALLCGVPWLLRHGLSSMATSQVGLHVLRIVFAVVGVQLWGAGLAQVEIWQAIALVMSSPFFVILGARVFLKEEVGVARLGATLVGFGGVAVILEPWAQGWQPAVLLPLGAAAFWGAASLITKKLSIREKPETVTAYLLLLLTPVNLAFAMTEGLAFPSSPTGYVAIAAAGLFTVCANYFLTLAYSKADAAYVQPFDHLKLPLNVAFGFLAFGFAPTGAFWPGALLIVAASLYVMHDERKRQAKGLLLTES